ncbi:MAG: aspartate--tRNA(Asn) ligase [Nanoarchaeota archaeon]|nr:aspartate--tRNA(Asn) ligase [Nanoarchaeota archaeon]
MNRTYIKDAFDKTGKVTLKGWVYDTRDLKKIRFLILRDVTGRIQVTGIEGKTNEETFNLIDKLKRESVVEITGELKESKQAPGGKELIPDSIIVIAEAKDPLPIDVSDFSKTELPLRLDNRFLDLHTRRTGSIFKIQSEIANAFREYFYNKGFIEMQSPCIISASSEGGTDLFKVKYFEKDAYLAQSPQLYKQMVACSMEKTFLITPVFRAEKYNTTRHINEIRQMDIEMAFTDQLQIMKYVEDVVKYIVKKILEKSKNELEILGIKNLKVPNAVYLTYEDAIAKVGGKFGDDFSPSQEKDLCKMYPGDIVFTSSWPAAHKPFYIMTKDENPDAKYSEGFDALYGGIEICSGGQRIHLPDLLIKMLKKKKLNPKDFKEYINSFRYGAPPHSGWSIGLERLTQIICGLDNVKEATLFPRDRDRLTP